MRALEPLEHNCFNYENGFFFLLKYIYIYIFNDSHEVMYGKSCLNV